MLITSVEVQRVMTVSPAISTPYIVALGYLVLHHMYVCIPVVCTEYHVHVYVLAKSPFLISQLCLENVWNVFTSMLFDRAF